VKDGSLLLRQQDNSNNDTATGKNHQPILFGVQKWISECARYGALTKGRLDPFHLFFLFGLDTYSGFIFSIDHVLHNLIESD
jgi:hypothetical protein